MLTHFTLQTRQQEIRYQGYFHSITECLEMAISQGVDCTFLNLRDMNLSQANLDGADFTGSDFTSANLTGTNMSETTLNKCSFANASFTDVCLCESRINEAVFFEASFSGTDVAGGFIVNCLFSCPSFYSLNMHEAAEISGCQYYHDGEYCPINTVPIILNGLNERIILLDDHLMIGHKVKKMSLWQEEFTQLHSDSCCDDHAAFYAAHRKLIHELADFKNARHNLAGKLHMCTA